MAMEMIYVNKEISIKLIITNVYGPVHLVIPVRTAETSFTH